MEGYTTREIIGCSAFILFFIFVQWVECGGKTSEKVADWLGDKLKRAFYLSTVIIRWIIVGLIIYFFQRWSIPVLIVFGLIIIAIKKIINWIFD